MLCGRNALRIAGVSGASGGVRAGVLGRRTNLHLALSVRPSDVAASGVRRLRRTLSGGFVKTMIYLMPRSKGWHLRMPASLRVPSDRFCASSHVFVGAYRTATRATTLEAYQGAWDIIGSCVWRQSYCADMTCTWDFEDLDTLASAPCCTFQPTGLHAYSR